MFFLCRNTFIHCWKILTLKVIKNLHFLFIYLKFLLRWEESCFNEKRYNYKYITKLERTTACVTNHVLHHKTAWELNSLYSGTLLGWSVLWTDMRKWRIIYIGLDPSYIFFNHSRLLPFGSLGWEGMSGILPLSRTGTASDQRGQRSFVVSYDLQENISIWITEYWTLCFWQWKGPTFLPG